MIEEEVFGRREIDLDEMERFGFSKEKGDYIFRRTLPCGMRAEVRVSASKDVQGRVFDEDIGEEYVLFRQEGAEGAFVTAVKNEYRSLLEEIANAISTPKLYVGGQANRLSAQIGDKYGVSAEFLWERFPHYGVYRHPLTGKWFGIIMDLDKKKVDLALSGKCEVMNLKTDDRTPQFIERGAYPSYHMNHNSWISVILDDSLSDETVFEMIGVSYENVGRKKGKRSTP